MSLLICIHSLRLFIYQHVKCKNLKQPILASGFINLKLPQVLLYSKMINLDVFHILLLEITSVSIGNKFSPVEFSVFGRVLLIDQLLQRLHHGIMGWEEEEWNRQPCLGRIHHHPVLHTLILVIAPNLYKHHHCLTIYINPVSINTQT